MKGLITSVFCIVFPVCFTFSPQIVHGSAGESGWSILNSAESVNSKGISAVSARNGSLLGAFYNPAILGAMRSRQIYLVSKMGYIEDPLGGIVYGEPLKNGILMASVFYYDAGAIELNWIDNNTLMTENVPLQRDVLGILSYGFKISRKILVGSSVKYATTELAGRYRATAYAADLGVLFIPEKNTTLSIGGRNAGTSTKFIAKENPLPTTGDAGLSYSYRTKNLALAPNIGYSYNFVEKTESYEGGLEIANKFISTSINYGSDKSFANTNILCGLTITVKNMELGYYYGQNTNLGAVQGINLGYHFSAKPVR